MEVLQRLNDGTILPTVGHKFKHDTVLDVCLVKALDDKSKETKRWKVLEIRSGGCICSNGYGSDTKKEAIQDFLNIWARVLPKDGLKTVNSYILDGHSLY